MRDWTRYVPSLLALATAAVTLLLGPLMVQRFTHARAASQAHVARARLQSSDVLAQLNEAVRDVARVVEPSVVHVTVMRDIGADQLILNEESTGSGWIYDDDGHIVTNQHVVRDAERIEVRFHDGTHREAMLVGEDPRTDIAVIRIVGSMPIIPAVRSAAPVRQGDLVFAFGSPFGFEFSMSSGVVSGQGRQTRTIGSGYENFIQTDADIHPGNSGGPLTNVVGEVVGMNTATAVPGNLLGGIDPSGTSGRTGSVGLAIPLDIIDFVVTQVIETGEVRNGGLGVELAELDTFARRRLDDYDGPGVLIERVLPGLAAEAAGLREDDIIVTVDGVRIERISALRTLIHTRRPGDDVTLRIRRGAAEFDAVVSLTEWDHAWDQPDGFERPGR